MNSLYIALIILFIAITLGATVRKLIGFGDAVLITPILLIFLDQIRIVTPLIGLTTLLMSLIILSLEGNKFKINREVIYFLIISLIGLAIGYCFLNEQFSLWLKLGLAILVLLICFNNLYFQKKSFKIHPIIKGFLAFISGVFSILFNMPGPTTALFFSNLNKRGFRATLSAYFLVIEPLSSFGHYDKGLLTTDIIVLFIFLGVPACLLGVLIATYFSKLEIPEKLFKKRINQFLILVALGILIQLSLEFFGTNFSSINLAGKLPSIGDIGVFGFSSVLIIYAFLIYLIRNSILSS